MRQVEAPANSLMFCDPSPIDVMIPMVKLAGGGNFRCGIDHKGHLIYAKGDEVFRVKQKTTYRIAEFNDLKLNP